MFWITQGYIDQKEFGAEDLKFCISKECWIMLSVAIVVVVFIIIIIIIIIIIFIIIIIIIIIL